jgi:hypothetical protein
MKDLSEDRISKINTNVFFKEFTFSKNDFKELTSKQMLEFADNVVWLDDICFVFQIKSRGVNEGLDVRKWFQNKIINKAVKQIKCTLKYMLEYPEILIENERGHILNIVEAKNCISFRKIVIYSPNEEFPNDLRQRHFYESSKIGLIHLFHLEDYYWICKYLYTPSEVDEYLDFRERFYKQNRKVSEVLPEQYLLGHFLETPEVDLINPIYIKNLEKLPDENEYFNHKLIIDFLSENLHNHKTEYYPILREVAKLNRTELNEFKKRFKKTVESCDLNEFVLPYRFYAQRIDCAFVFIPLSKENGKNWKNALSNFTLAHKYEVKSKKCIGITIFRSEENLGKSFHFFWGYEEREWIYDSIIEEILANNYPFRKLTSNEIENRYKNNN